MSKLKNVVVLDKKMLNKIAEGEVKVDGRKNNTGRPVNKKSARQARLAKQAFYANVNDKFKKGNVINVARIAGIMGAKQTSSLIPLCHNINLDSSDISFRFLEEELEATKHFSSNMIGINNRDLNTFNTDIETTVKLFPNVPKNKTVISESGLSKKSDLERLAKLGVSSFLVGESLMRQEDLEKATKLLMNQ